MHGFLACVCLRSSNPSLPLYPTSPGHRLGWGQGLCSWLPIPAISPISDPKPKLMCPNFTLSLSCSLNLQWKPCLLDRAGSQRPTWVTVPQASRLRSPAGLLFLTRMEPLASTSWTSFLLPLPSLLSLVLILFVFMA